MNKKLKTYKKEFNRLNKDNPLRLVTKRWDNLFKSVTIFFFVIILLASILTVIAQEKISFKEDGIVIKVQHEITPDSMEKIIKYIDFFINKNETE